MISTVYVTLSPGLNGEYPGGKYFNRYGWNITDGLTEYTTIPFRSAIDLRAYNNFLRSMLPSKSKHAGLVVPLLTLCNYWNNNVAAFTFAELWLEKLLDEQCALSVPQAMKYHKLTDELLTDSLAPKYNVAKTIARAKKRFECNFKNAK